MPPNGSEFNFTVARLLDKLLIEHTKSRAHRTGDNGLVECKNAAIVRKHMGFTHIAAQHAEAVDRFHRQHLNPYVNFHRPCAIAEIVEESNGKRRRVYRRWATPFEIFGQTAECGSFLRPGVSMADLERFAKAQSDTEAAIEMQQAKRQLLAESPGKAPDRRFRRTNPERHGNDGRVEREENQGRVSPLFPPPLEIAGAISTFPPRQRPFTLLSKPKTKGAPRYLPCPPQFRLILRADLPATRLRFPT